MKLISIGILLIFISCQTQFRYEGSYYHGKSYMSKFVEVDAISSDSVCVTGYTFVKRKGALKTSFAKIYWINSNQDTIQKIGSGIYGFSFYINPGKYRCVIEANGCNTVITDSINYQSGKFYLMNFFLQKGNGSDKWYMN